MDDCITGTQMMITFNKYYLARKKRGLVSKIVIDDMHYIFIRCEHIDYINEWFIHYICCHIQNDIHLITSNSITKAKTVMFELSKTKCTHCYDEQGNRKRDN
jgi:hypothetical protein